MANEFSPDVLANVLNHSNQDELRVVADQCVREIKAGADIDETLTAAQFSLGLSFGNTQRVEAMVKEAVAPPGREDQVKELKKHKDISNPYAVAWHSYDQSKNKEPKKEGADSTDPWGMSHGPDENTPAKIRTMPPEPRKEGAGAQSLSGQLDPDDPLDMAILGLLENAIEAGVLSGDENPAVVLKMLISRLEELLEANSGFGGQSPLPKDIPPSEGSVKEAGLKSTLRKLRQQLNKHDNEDIEGMSKLITCIEGVERQLERKQKSKEDRAKKKSEAPASDDEKEAEAAAPTGAVPAGTPGDLPADQSQPEELEKPHPSVMPDPVELAGQAIDFGILKSKVAQLKKDIEATWKLKEREQDFELNVKPKLLGYLETVEGGRLLVEQAEQKWSLLRVQEKPGEPSLDKSKLLEGIKGRIAEAVKSGVKFATELEKSIKGMEASPAYQTPGTEKAPYLKMQKTPKDLELAPHHKVPQKRSSLFSSAGFIDSLLSSFTEALQEIADLVDIAEDKLAPAY